MHTEHGTSQKCSKKCISPELAGLKSTLIARVKVDVENRAGCQHQNNIATQRATERNSGHFVQVWETSEMLVVVVKVPTWAMVESEASVGLPHETCHIDGGVDTKRQ